MFTNADLFQSMTTGKPLLVNSRDGKWLYGKVSGMRLESGAGGSNTPAKHWLVTVDGQEVYVRTIA